MVFAPGLQLQRNLENMIITQKLATCNAM